MSKRTGRITFVLFLALLYPLPAGADDPFEQQFEQLQEAAVEGALERAADFRLTESETIEYDELKARLEVPVRQLREQYRAWKTALGKTPTNATDAQRRARVRNIEMTVLRYNQTATRMRVKGVEKSLAAGQHREVAAWSWIREFYVRECGQFTPYLTDAEKEQWWAEARRQSTCAPSLAAFEGYQRAYRATLEKLAGVAAKASQMQWSCKQKDPEAGNLVIRLRHPTAENVHDWAEDGAKELDDGVRMLQQYLQGREEEGSYIRPTFPQIVLNWEANAELDGKSVTIDVKLLGGHDPVLKPIRTWARLVAEEFPLTAMLREHGLAKASELVRRECPEVLAGENFAYFYHPGRTTSSRLSKGPRVIFVRTEHGLFQINIDLNVYHFDLDEQDRARVKSQMADDLARLLIEAFASGHVPQTPQPALAFTALDDPELVLSPGEPSRCRLVARYHGDGGKPIKGATLCFYKPAHGILVSDRTGKELPFNEEKVATVQTDELGEYRVTYTAPTAQELGQQGLDGTQDLDVRLSAWIHSFTYNEDLRRELTVHVRNKASAPAWARYDVIPASKEYTNEVHVKFLEDVGPPDREYRVRASTSMTHRAQLAFGGKQSEYSIDLGKLQYHQDYTVTYRWDDKSYWPYWDKPFEEVVTFTVYDVTDGTRTEKAKVEVRFHVGIDLAIKEVRLAYGDEPLPWEANPLHVYVENKFAESYPQVSLKQIFDDFDLEPSLRIVQQGEFKLAPMTPIEHNNLERFWRMADLDVPEGIESCYVWGLRRATVKPPSVPGDKSQWILHNKYWKEQKKTYWFPTLLFMRRGDFVFDVVLQTGPYDLDYEENTPFENRCVRPVTFAVRLYECQELERLHRSLLVGYDAIIQGFLAILAGGGGGYAPSSTPMQLAKLTKVEAGFAQLSTTSWKFALAEGSTKVSAVSAWAYTSLDMAGQIAEGETEQAVFLAITNNAALYNNFKPLFAELKHLEWGTSLNHSIDFTALVVSLRSYLDEVVQVITGGGNRIQKGGDSPAPKASRDEAEMVLRQCLAVHQQFMKRLGNYYVIVLEEDGLDRCRAALADGKPIEPAPPNLVFSENMPRYLDRAAGYLVIPALMGEHVKLDLAGRRGNGRLIMVAPDHVRAYDYPQQEAWQVMLDLNGSGIDFQDGKALDWQEDPGLSTLPPLSPTPDQPSPQPQPEPEPEPEPQPQPPARTFHGKWDSQYGTVELRIVGNDVRGRFGDDGKISGTLSGDGRVLTGKWGKAPTFRPPRHAGYFEFRLAPDARSFAARWWPANHKEAAKPWQAERIE